MCVFSGLSLVDYLLLWELIMFIGHISLGLFFFGGRSAFLLKDNCFTILCQFLPFINISQPQAYTFPVPLEPPSHLPPHPSPLGCHRAPVWTPCITQWSPTGYVLHKVMHMFQCYSLHTSHPFLPPLCSQSGGPHSLSNCTVHHCVVNRVPITGHSWCFPSFAIGKPRYWKLN